MQAGQVVNLSDEVFGRSASNRVPSAEEIPSVVVPFWHIAMSLPLVSGAMMAWTIILESSDVPVSAREKKNQQPTSRRT
jgi:hypothetical protein